MYLIVIPNGGVFLCKKRLFTLKKRRFTQNALIFLYIRGNLILRFSKPISQIRERSGGAMLKIHNAYIYIYIYNGVSGKGAVCLFSAARSLNFKSRYFAEVFPAAKQRLFVFPPLVSGAPIN